MLQMFRITSIFKKQFITRLHAQYLICPNIPQKTYHRLVVTCWCYYSIQLTCHFQRIACRQSSAMYWAPQSAQPASFLETVNHLQKTWRAAWNRNLLDWRQMHILLWWCCVRSHLPISSTSTEEMPSFSVTTFWASELKWPRQSVWRHDANDGRATGMSSHSTDRWSYLKIRTFCKLLLILCIFLISYFCMVKVDKKQIKQTKQNQHLLIKIVKKVYEKPLEDEKPNKMVCMCTVWDVIPNYLPLPTVPALSWE